MVEENNPLKTDKKLKLLKKFASHSCLLITVLSFQYILLGLVAIIFNYHNKGHLIIFALISLIESVCGPLGYYGIKTGNRLYLMIISVINVIWMICALLMFIVYWIIFDDPAFDSEIALHVGGVIFLGASMVLAISSFMLLRRLNMVSVNLSPPNIKLSPEGKAKK